MIGSFITSTSISEQSPRFSTDVFDYNYKNHQYLLMLRDTIESIYVQEHWGLRGISPYSKDHLINELFDQHNYPLLDIKSYSIKESEFPPFFYNLLKFEFGRGDLWFEPWMDDNHEFGVTVFKQYDKVNLLLMKSLSQVLVKCFISDLPPYLNKYKDITEDHYVFLKQQKDWVQLLKIDFTPNIKRINKVRMLNTFYRCLDNIPVMYNLIKGFIGQRIINPDKVFYIFNTWGVPPIGEFTHVIYHLFYHHNFDRVIEKLYPGITYTRCGQQVFIVLKPEDRFLNTDIEINQLLDNRLLTGNIQRIVPSEDEDVFMCPEGCLYTRRGRYQWV